MSRHNLASPAHPSHALSWHGQLQSQGHSMHSQPNAYSQQRHVLSTSQSTVAQHTSTHEYAFSTQQPEATTDQHSSPQKQPERAPCSCETEQQVNKLQAVLTTVDIAKAVAKHPLLLSYSPATLQAHMRQLELLVGAHAAASMVVKMPQLLHYKSSTLAAKMDHLYNLLPQADVEKVRSGFIRHQSLSSCFHWMPSRLYALKCCCQWWLCHCAFASCGANLMMYAVMVYRYCRSS